MDFEIRADGSLHIEGYVNAVERDSRAVVCPECGKCVEQIAAGAFGEALRAAHDVAMLVNHDRGRKIGSLSEGNLTLYEDNIGLRAVAVITDSEVIEKARRGLLRGWSFGFKARDTDIERRAGNLPRRRVKALDIFEVSIIDDRFSPCYAGTSIEMRAGNEELMEMRSENIVGNVSGLSEYIGRYNRIVLNEYRLRAKMPGVLPWGEEQRGNGPNFIQLDNGQMNGSRPSGNKSSGNSGKGVDKSEESDIIKLSDISIGKTLGAKAKNYDIIDLQTGEKFNLTEGTYLQNVEVFAGKGVKSEYRQAYKMAKKYGGNEKDWQHVKGIGIVNYYGEERSAELHWSQCENIGKHEFFIKEWLD